MVTEPVAELLREASQGGNAGDEMEPHSRI